MDDLRDARNRRLKIGARVRGTISPGIETHGVVVCIWVSEKHGPVLVIDDGQYDQNVPASQCRRMYGHTNASRETAEIARAVRERSEAAAAADAVVADVNRLVAGADARKRRKRKS